MSTFQTSRRIPASPEAVFGAIADPARLARWWGPDGFTNTFQTFDFIAGGHWHYVMHGPNGADYPNESIFKEIVPNRRVVIQHISKPNFELTISLTAVGSETDVSWTQAFDDPQVAEAMRHIVEPANEQNLDRLAAEVRSPAQD